MALKEGDHIREASSNVVAFIQDFHLGAEQLKSMEHFITKRGIEVEEGDIEANVGMVERFIKIPLARYVYGREAYYQALAAYDDDVLSALTAINEGTVKELGLR